jgi:hypothetical protein
VGRAILVQLAREQPARLDRQETRAQLELRGRERPDLQGRPASRELPELLALA